MKKALAFLLAAALCLSLAACSGGSSSAAPPASSGSGAASSGSEAGGIVKGGTLTIAGGTTTPTTLAWYDIRGIMAVANLGYFYEPIMRYGENGSPEPFLIDSITPDSGALTWTMIVRDGINFSDGSPLNAEALAWNLNFYKEKGVLTGSFFGKFDNAEATDDMTVVCHFTEWDALFDYALCRTVLVASKDAFDKNGEEWLVANPVGTGPFLMSELNADVNMLMKRNDNYWRGEVYLDAVNLVCYSQELVAATALQSGEVHAMVTENYSMVEQLAGSGVELQQNSVALPSYAYTLCFNSVDPADPFSDVKVREAAGYAIDTQAILDTLTYGYAVATNQWTKPGSEFYNSDVKAQPYDAEKAKSLLAEAGYADGFDTTLTYADGNLIGSTAQIIQEQLAAVGIRVTLQPIEAAAYVNYIGGWEQGMLLHMMGMEAGAASQYTTTFINGVAFGLGMNAFAISDELDSLARSIGTAPTQEELIKNTQATAAMVFDQDVLCKVVLVTQGVSFVRPEVHDHEYCTVQNLRGDVWRAWIEQ